MGVKEKGVISKGTGGCPALSFATVVKKKTQIKNVFMLCVLISSYGCNTVDGRPENFLYCKSGIDCFERNCC